MVRFPRQNILIYINFKAFVLPNRLLTGSYNVEFKKEHCLGEEGMQSSPNLELGSSISLDYQFLYPISLTFRTPATKTFFLECWSYDIVNLMSTPCCGKRPYKIYNVLALC